MSVSALSFQLQPPCLPCVFMLSISLWTLTPRTPNPPRPLTPKLLFLLQVALITVFYHSNRKWFCLVEALESSDIHSVLKYAFLEMVSDLKTDTEKNGIQFYKRWDGTGELVSGCEGGDIEKEYINPFRMGTIENPGHIRVEWGKNGVDEWTSR